MDWFETIIQLYQALPYWIFAINFEQYCIKHFETEINICCYERRNHNATGIETIKIRHIKHTIYRYIKHGK